MGAHPGRTVRDAFLQGSAGPGADVLDGEVALCRSDPSDDMGLSLGFRGAAVDDAGFVEVDVGLDKAAADQPPGRVIARALAGQARLDRYDATLLDADIEKPATGGAILGTIGNSGVANN
jgi:hypothetical protein